MRSTSSAALVRDLAHGVCLGLAAALLSACAGIAPQSDALPAAAQMPDAAGRTGHGLRVIAENDFFAINNRSDRYYTNGLRFEYKLPARATPDAAIDLARSLPFFPKDPEETTLALIGGQSIFTPADITDPLPRLMDRPYAGWSYVGATLRSVDFAETRAGDSLNVFEVQTGVVGPSARADVVQTEWHEWFEFREPRGWRYQLRDEFGLNLVYTHAQRLASIGTRNSSRSIGADTIVKLSGSLGNVTTHAEAGIFVRAGIALPRDFVVGGIHTGIGDAGPRASTYAYLFGGVHGRAVLRNIFLDGNTFRSSPSVDREVFVGEIRGGAAVGLGAFELSYSFVIQSPEFSETDQSQQFGSLMLSYSSR